MPTIEMTNIIEGTLGGYTVAGAPVAGTSEVQTLTIGGTPTSGTFTLTYDGYTTSAITWTATDATLVADVDAALEALPNIGAGDITAADGTLTSGIGTITLTFAGALALKNVPLITCTSSLVGTLPTAVVTLTTPGVDSTARTARLGAQLTDTTNGILYITTTTNPPTWVSVGSQS